MIKEFKSFLTSTNAIALAIGVIIGAATGKLVTAIVSDVLMPIVSLFIPSGDWREAEIVLRTTTDAAGKLTITAIKYGDLFGTLLDFLIIASVVFLITKAVMGKKKEPAKPETRVCPECLETIPAQARRCKFCTAEVSELA